MTQLPPSTLAGHIISRCQTKRSISSPEATILLVCARNRDLWPKLKARQKDGQISLAVETCSFQPQSPIKPEPGFPGSGFGFDQSPCASRPLVKGTEALGTRLRKRSSYICQQSCQKKILSITSPLVEMLVDNTVYEEIYTIIV